MNHYQKASTFVLRACGLVLAIIGLMGPIMAISLAALGRGLPEYPAERWRGSLTYAIVGILLMVFAKQIGRLLGRGLE